MEIALFSSPVDQKIVLSDSSAIQIQHIIYNNVQITNSVQDLVFGISHNVPSHPLHFKAYFPPH